MVLAKLIRDQICFDLLSCVWWSGCAATGTDLACNITDISHHSYCLLLEFTWPPQCQPPAQNLHRKWQGGDSKKKVMQKRESYIPGPGLHEKQAATAEGCPGGSLELTFVCHWIISFHLSHNVLCVVLSLFMERRLAFYCTLVLLFAFTEWILRFHCLHLVDLLCLLYSHRDCLSNCKETKCLKQPSPSKIP